jgi:hypothetical protein
MRSSELGAPAPPPNASAPPCGPRGPRVSVATSGCGGAGAESAESESCGSIPCATRTGTDRRTDGCVDDGSAVASGGAADAVPDSGAPSTKTANVGFRDWVASAIPGSGEGLGVNDAQLAPEAAASQTAASCPCWWSPRTSVAAIPIEPAESVIAGWLATFPADSAGVRGGPDPPDPLPPAAAFWPTEEVAGLTPGSAF